MTLPDLTPHIKAAELVEILGCDRLRADLFVVPINMALERYGIAERRGRVAHFIAQVGHESGRLRHVREIWGPTAAQARYEARADLGNTQPGDGFRFRGRGLIQITGRGNYAICGSALGLDLESNPRLLETPLYAALSAGWYWHARGLNRYADEGRPRTITRRINGGLNGISDRLAILDRARQVLLA